MRRRPTRALGLLSLGSLAALAATSACSLLTPLDGYDGEPPVAVDGGAPDGPLGDGGLPPSDDAADTGAREGGGDDASLANLHPAGTFESGCAPWSGFQGFALTDPLARSGAKSCRVCTAPATTDYFTLDDNGTPGAAVLGARYRATAWVRTAPGAPAPPAVALKLRTFTAPPFTEYDLTQSPDTALDATWQKLTVEMTVTDGPGALNVYVSAYHAAGACFLVDDVELVRLD